MKFHIIIPVRLESIRFPNKPLAEIAGKPMMQWTYERAKSSDAASVIIATDSVVVAEIATKFDAQVCMTSSNHASGTSRIAEVASKQGWGDDVLVVNVQGDEPLIPKEHIYAVADCLANSTADVATLCCDIENIKDVFNPNCVKVVMTKDGSALYFSRAPIPWDRESFALDPKLKFENYFKHIGLYAYRCGFLSKYAQLAESPLEKIECLEQLRVLWHGGKIQVRHMKTAPMQDVNTPEDLLAVEKFFVTGQAHV